MVVCLQAAKTMKYGSGVEGKGIVEIDYAD
jgi:hypothetical protein